MFANTQSLSGNSQSRIQSSRGWKKTTIYGDTRSKICAPEVTSIKGYDLSVLVAHAFRELAKASEIVIQNGGGVRTDIAKGDLTMGDAYKLLPFENTLVEMDMSGAEIKTVLEEALDYALQCVVFFICLL